MTFKDQADRQTEIDRGVTYGNENTRGSIGFVLDVVSKGMDNGRAIALQIKETLNKLFENVRADVIAEYFSKEANAATLFQVGRELDKCAFAAKREDVTKLSADAKSVVGVFADFTRSNRMALFSPISPASEETKVESKEPLASRSTAEQPKLI